MEVDSKDNNVIWGTFIFGRGPTNKNSDNKEYNVIFLMNKDVPNGEVPSAEIVIRWSTHI